MSSLLNRRVVCLAMLSIFGAASVSAAAEARVSVVYVKDMHCGNCAKKIASKLYAVPGVTKVVTDVKSGTATISGQAQRDPSPRALWEAVEAATFEPVKLTCSAGTFKSKPKV